MAPVTGTAAEVPALSVILPFQAEFAEVLRTVAALARQSVAGSIEIILVAPSSLQAGIDPVMLRPFCGWQLLEHPVKSHGSMYAAGIHHARAPLAALGEDHSFPAPNWAENLIAAHARGDWAVAGPAIRNGNPSTYISWADFYIAYGKWAVPIPSQEMDFLPGHNSCYRCSYIKEYGARLESMLDAEVVMHWDLRARGLKLWLEASTYTQHLNFAQFRPWVGAQLYAGRLFAAKRSGAWAGWRRGLYAAAAPLIPFVRFARIHQDIQRAGHPIFFRWRLYAYIVSGLGVDAVGQFLGYLFGIGEHGSIGMQYEFGRERFV